MEDPLRARRDFAASCRFLRPPPFLLQRGRGGAYSEVTAGPVSGQGVLLWLHGGAYLLGSSATHAPMLGRISRLARLAVIAPDYRLAPEHPAPAAFEDAVAAHSALLDLGWRPEQIVLGGDSAGGGLALALLADLCRRDLRPAGLVALSPWTDLTAASDSLQRNAAREPLFPAEKIGFLIGLVKGCLSPDDPRLSPMFASFDRPPPVLIHVGSDEILHDDSIRMAAHLRQAGGDVSVQICEGGLHVWHMLDGWVPEARESLREVARFCRHHLSISDTTR